MSFFRVDICPWRLVFCCFSLSFSAVNRCIFSASVSPGNGSGTGSGSGNRIGSGYGDGPGISGGPGSFSVSNANVNCKELTKRSTRAKPKIRLLFIL